VLALFVLDGTRQTISITRRRAPDARGSAEGAWFSNAHVTSVPTLTAVGHANRDRAELHPMARS
jgi:hypothetical protein